MTNEADVPPGKPGTPEQPEDTGETHDALFFKTFSRPENAAAELKRVMRRELVARIQWSTLELESNKFVDSKLSSRYSDVLFSVCMGKKNVLIYVLFEHKSTNDWWTLLQVLEYMPRIWRTYVDNKNNRGKKHLPVILPVVLHHSEQGWTCPLRFREYFEMDPEDAELLNPFMLDFGVLLDDISHLDAAAIARLPVTTEARVVLFALRFGRTAHKVIEQMPSIARDLVTLQQDKVHGEVVISAFIVYLTRVGKVPQAELHMALQQTVGNSLADEIMFGAERRLEAAELKGKLEGEIKGKLEGKLEVLKELLTQRFGALAPKVHARINAATSEELHAMARRVLTATSLDEVLAPPKTKRAPRRSR